MDESTLGRSLASALIQNRACAFLDEEWSTWQYQSPGFQSPQYPRGSAGVSQRILTKLAEPGFPRCDAKVGANRIRRCHLPRDGAGKSEAGDFSLGSGSGDVPGDAGPGLRENGLAVPGVDVDVESLPPRDSHAGAELISLLAGLQYCYAPLLIGMKLPLGCLGIARVRV